MLWLRLPLQNPIQQWWLQQKVVRNSFVSVRKVADATTVMDVKDGVWYVVLFIPRLAFSIRNEFIFATEIVWLF